MPHSASNSNLVIFTKGVYVNFRNNVFQLPPKGHTQTVQSHRKQCRYTEDENLGEIRRASFTREIRLSHWPLFESDPTLAAAREGRGGGGVAWKIRGLSRFSSHCAYKRGKSGFPRPGLYWKQNGIYLTQLRHDNETYTGFEAFICSFLCSTDVL